MADTCESFYADYSMVDSARWPLSLDVACLGTANALHYSIYVTRHAITIVN